MNPRVKYPRTFHLPWSDGVASDDKMMSSIDGFIGKRVIVTEKMDGENTTMYSDYIHARSIDGRAHSSRDWVKQFHSEIMGNIPDRFRVCGENLYAKHSIGYNDLSTYFMGFSIWDEKNTCLDWDSTLQWFELLGVTHVPILYDGIYDEKIVKSLHSEKDWGTSEGYVLRVADSITYSDFRNKVGKFVRKGHVQTAKHWMYGQAVEKNLLRK